VKQRGVGRLFPAVEEFIQLRATKVAQHTYDVLLRQHVQVFALTQHVKCLLDLFGYLNSALRLELAQDKVLFLRNHCLIGHYQRLYRAVEG